MRPQFRRSCSLAVLVATLAASARAQAPGEPVRYGRDIRPLLADRCFRCHGPDESTREANLRLDRREDATAARKHGAAIVPGDAKASLVAHRVVAGDPDERMPPARAGKAMLTAEEVERLSRWIDEGATYEAHWAFEPPVAPPVPAVQVGTPQNPIDNFVFAALARRGLAPSPLADRRTLARRAFLVATGLPPTPDELAAFERDTRPDAYEHLVDRLLGEEPYRSRHAEHLAQPWLDAARYADTCGIHMDAGRQIWPWRDWLLRALRDDLPFDRFVVDQLAGDLLPDATLDQRVATGFLRAHVTTDEGGAIDEEYLIEYAAERTATLGTVFLGLTLNCARCHDHKFDPIPQDDYYGLFAFFHSNDEPGLYSQSPNASRALEPFLEVPSADQQQERARLTDDLAAAEAASALDDPAEAGLRAQFFADLARESGIAWPTAPVTAASSRDGATLLLQPDGSVLASGENPPRDAQTITLRAPQGGLRLLCVEALPDPSLPEGKIGRAPNGNAVLDHVELAVRAAGAADFTPVPLTWAIADIEQTDGDFRVTNALAADHRGWAVAAHQYPVSPRRALFLAERPFGGDGAEVRVTLRYDSIYSQHVLGRVRLHLGTVAEPMLARFPVASGGFYLAGPFEHAREALYPALDGPEGATALDLGAKFGKRRWQFHAAGVEGAAPQDLPQGQNATYVAHELFVPSPREHQLSLGSDDGFRLFVDGREVAGREVDRAVAPDQDQAKCSTPDGTHLAVLKIVNTGGLGGYSFRRAANQGELDGDLRLWLFPAATHDDALRARLADAWRERYSPGFAARRGRVAAAKDALAALDARTPRTMVMRERAEPRPTFVLTRGEYDKPDRARPIQPHIPAMFGAPRPVSDQPLTRLDLARWLVSPADPLLNRVTMNRLFEFVFGVGIVRTSEDFGRAGEWPSNKELLDWLATEFRSQGHSVRAMLRLMMTSATFRQQSAVAAAAFAVDPEDRLLGWFPRRRLSGETIRDQALYTSGLLVEHFGGPSVKSYQPPGLWQEVAMVQSNTRIYERGSGAELWRRSLYSYWKRACPPPTLLTLDAPTREFCTVRRSTTNTPLQALALWNDEQFVEAARVLAQRTLATPGDDGQHLAAMHERCTGHPLDPARLDLAKGLLQRLRERYRQTPDDATALLALGEAPRDAQLPPVELAAWTLVASAFLDLDSTVFLD